MNLGMPYRKRLRLPARGVVAALVVAGAVASQVAPGAASTRNPFQAISAEKAGRAGPADPSGVPMPKGNLPGWTQVYANDFTLNVPRGAFSGCIAARTVWLSVCTGLPAGERRLLWAYPSSHRDNSGHPYEPQADLSISHGELDDYLHHDAAATALPKIRYGGGGGMVHGAYVVRFRANPVAGYKTAFLLWPESLHWPQDGEIDFPEGDLNTTITANMHWQGGTTMVSRDFYNSHVTYRGWHTAVTEWTRNRCAFFLDGKLVGVSTARIPDTPMYWVLQVETRGDPVRTSHVDIDWAVAYRPS